MRPKSEHCLLELHQAISTLAMAVVAYGRLQNDMSEIHLIEKWKALDALIITTFKPDIKEPKHISDGTVEILDHIGQQLHLTRQDLETRIQKLQKLIAQLTSAGKYLLEELEEADDIMDP